MNSFNIDIVVVKRQRDDLKFEMTQNNDDGQNNNELRYVQNKQVLNTHDFSHTQHIHRFVRLLICCFCKRFIVIIINHDTMNKLVKIFREILSIAFFLEIAYNSMQILGFSS